MSGELSPAYLICSDDEAKIERVKDRLRMRAREGGADASIEAIDGDDRGAERFATAVRSMTLIGGRRFVIADGVEKWKAADVKIAESALASLDAETTCVLVCRGRVSERMAKAVDRAGGEILRYSKPKPWELPRWTVDRAREMGLVLDVELAGEIVARTGRNQTRIVRELEKLAMLSAGRAVDREEIRAAISGSAESRAYELADAVVDGDRPRAVALAAAVGRQGESRVGIVAALARQVRAILQASERLKAGHAADDVSRDLRMPPFAAKRILKQARTADSGRLRRTVALLADLDDSLKGASSLSPETLLTVALARAT